MLKRLDTMMMFTVADVASDAPEFVQPLTDNITTPHGGSATFYCRVRSYGAPHIQVCIETAKAVHSSVVVLLYFFANDFLRRRQMDVLEMLPQNEDIARVLSATVVLQCPLKEMKYKNIAFWHVFEFRIAFREQNCTSPCNFHGHFTQKCRPHAARVVV